MANYASKDVSVEVNSVNMTAGITDAVATELAALCEDTTPYGVSWPNQTWSGLKEGTDIPLGGLYDSTPTTGTDAVFGGGLGSTVPVIITYGGTKTSSFNAIISKYKRSMSAKKLHRYTATLTITGAVTEA